jgi:GNAT superfamily N-acetyltransferase
MSIEVRPFQRSHREQVTALVNAHIQAVVPGVSVSVNAVMSQLEREPGEYIVDPWVAERAALVAVVRQRVVAATLLHRYAADERVSDSYRGAGELRWLLCWTEAAHAGDALTAAAIAQLERWAVTRQYADGTLPAIGVYGVADSWPHIAAIYERAGFVPSRPEVVFVAAVDEVRRPENAPLDGLVARRELGFNGTRFSAVLGDDVIGYVEVESDHTSGGTFSRLAGWADIGNLHVQEAYRRRGVGTWLVGQAAEWLRLGGVARLLSYAEPDDTVSLAFHAHVGFAELTRTRRGWARTTMRSE